MALVWVVREWGGSGVGDLAVVVVVAVVVVAAAAVVAVENAQSEMQHSLQVLLAAVAVVETPLLPHVHLYTHLLSLSLYHTHRHAHQPPEPPSHFHQYTTCEESYSYQMWRRLVLVSCFRGTFSLALHGLSGRRVCGLRLLARMRRCR